MLKIQVVGMGCPNCQKLTALCQEVIVENAVEGHVEKVTDFNKFAELGVMLTPALIINGELKSSGKIPTKSTLEHWLKNAVNASKQEVKQ